MATSYSNPGGQGNRIGMFGISATFSPSGGAVTDLIDGTQSNEFWYGAAWSSGKEIEFDFTSMGPQIIDEFAWTRDTSGGGAWGRWQFYYWDGASWNAIGTEFDITGTSGSHGFTNTTGYDKYKIVAVTGTNFTGTPYIREFEFKIEAAPEVTETETEEPIIPAVYDFSTPGSDDFTLPNYYKLIVEAWGPAASGSLPQGSSPHGEDGSAATTISTFGMSAGPGLKATTAFINEFVWSRSSGGLGGSASGGNVLNLTGGQGENGGRTTTTQAPGKGGDAPFGGPGGPRGTGQTNGAAGTWPGGAGAGAQQSQTGLLGVWEIGTVTQAGPGGGAGGYSRSEFLITDMGAPTPGDLIEFFIGTGGDGVSDFGLTSGPGAHGGVRITIQGEPPSEPDNDGVGTVDITGEAQCGETLTAVFNDDDPDGSADLDALLYQWKRDGTPISGALGPTYVLQAADVGETITVSVTYVDGQGFVETITSDATAEVLPPPRPLDYFEESPHDGTEIFACYSYRLLRSAYTGPLVRLLAGSLEAEEQDFYPDANGELDYAAIQTWRDGTDEFTSVKVLTWYDQSGNGRHLGQAQTVSNIPLFAASGEPPYTIPSGRAAIQFNGNQQFARFSVNGPNTALGFLSVQQRDDSIPGPVFSFDVEGGTEAANDAGFFIARTSAQDWDDNAAVFHGHGINSGLSPRAIKQGPFPENDTDDVTIWDGELSARRVGLRRNSRALNLNVKVHSAFYAIPESTLLVGPRIFDTGYTAKMTEFVLFGEDVRDTLSEYRDDAAVYYMTFLGEEPTDPSEYISDDGSEGDIIPDSESDAASETASDMASETPATEVTNNDIANAYVIGLHETDTVGNTGYDKEPGEPNHAENPGGASAWWSFTSPISGAVLVTTSEIATIYVNSEGSSLDTLLAVYRPDPPTETETGDTVFDHLALVAENDDDPYVAEALTSGLIFEAEMGVTYWIAVDGYDGDTGLIALTVTTPGAPEPSESGESEPPEEPLPLAPPVQVIVSMS